MSRSLQQSSSLYNTAVVKFFGRSIEVHPSEPTFASTVDGLLATTGTVVEYAKKQRNNALWKGLEEDLTALTNYVLNPESRLRRFQIDLLNEVLVPYLRKMTGQWRVDEYRFRQVRTVVHSLIVRDVQEHPAVCLLALDDVANEIRANQSYMFRSELLNVIETATAKQWQPIVSDNRVILQDFGGKFLFLGLIGVVGWPAALLYPMYRYVIIRLCSC